MSSIIFRNSTIQIFDPCIALGKYPFLGLTSRFNGAQHGSQTDEPESCNTLINDREKSHLSNRTKEKSILFQE